MKWIRPLPMTKEALEAFFSAKMRCEVTVELTSYQGTFIRFSMTSSKQARLSLHRFFLRASSEILEHAIFYLRDKKKRSLGILRLFFEQPFFAKSTAMLPQKVVGACYDLREVYRDVENRYLPYPIDPFLGWFTRPKKSQHSLTYGAFSRTDWLIKINDLLDRETVPRYFLEYVIYHEALHAICPPQLSRAGRVFVHTKKFKLWEKKFPKLSEALAFEKTFFLNYLREQSHGRT
ncbi:MAG: hypothetical protein AAGI90_02440 [Chlamydiota bacterium]